MILQIRNMSGRLLSHILRIRIRLLYFRFSLRPILFRRILIRIPGRHRSPPHLLIRVALRMKHLMAAITEGDRILIRIHPAAPVPGLNQKFRLHRETTQEQLFPRHPLLPQTSQAQSHLNKIQQQNDSGAPF